MREEFSVGYIVLAFLLAVGGGVLGASLATSHRRLCALISLGAGTLLGVTVFGILPESHEGLNWWELLVALASGYVVFALITKYVYHVCPACAASHFDEATTHRFSEFASAMMIALAIHCTVDGLALAAGHEAQETKTVTGNAAGLSIVMAVCVHKIPEGLVLGALLLGAGLKRYGVIWRVAAVEATTLLGGFAGLYWMQHISVFWIGAALAHAGGGFLFLAAHAVLGEILKHHKGLVLTCFGTGFGTIGLFTLLLRLF